MNQLDTALKRLDSAVDQLDDAVNATLDRKSKENDLRNELEAVRGQNAELTAVTDTVSTKLNGTINQLESLING